MQCHSSSPALSLTPPRGAWWLILVLLFIFATPIFAAPAAAAAARWIPVEQAASKQGAELPAGSWRLSLQQPLIDWMQRNKASLVIKLSDDRVLEVDFSTAHRVQLRTRGEKDVAYSGKLSTAASRQGEAPLSLVRMGQVLVVEVAGQAMHFEPLAGVTDDQPGRVFVSVSDKDARIASAPGKSLGVTALRGGIDPKQPYKTPSYLAFANYLGWFPADYHPDQTTALRQDFSVYPLPNPLPKEFRDMAAHGWNVVTVDHTFFSPSRFLRQYRVLEDAFRALDASGLSEFHIVPFLEVQRNDKLDPAVTGSALAYLLESFARDPRWLRLDGRPVAFIYRTQLRPITFWHTVDRTLAHLGWSVFWIGDLTDINVSVLGEFDADAWRPYAKFLDGVFSFSASTLLVASQMPSRFRAAYAADFPKLLFGATIRTGYLSARPYNHNFESPDGTAMLRKTWEMSLAQDPDFLHMTTWNDYNEATGFGRSFSLLSSLLEISDRYMRRYTHRPLPEGDGKPQAVLSYYKSTYANEPIPFEFLPLPTLRGPKNASITIDLIDGQGRVLKSFTKRDLAMDKMKPWRFQFGGVSREQTHIVRVRPTLVLANGDTIRYANLPDIPVVPGSVYNDQLYYSIPLHRLAGSDRSVAMVVNGHVATKSAIVPGDGLDSIGFKITGAPPAKVSVAAAHNSMLLRMMAPLDRTGAWSTPSRGSGTVQLRSLPKGQPQDRGVDLYPSPADGSDYYTALARFPDGRWAYSPLVWTEPAIDPSSLVARWVFNKAGDDRVIRDRSGHGYDLRFDGAGAPVFETLPGGMRALRLDGHERLIGPLKAIPNGPVSVEAIFRPDRIDCEQVIIAQRGAQATLMIRPDGRLEARRLPRHRIHPNPFVEVASRASLIRNRFIHVCLTYDGRQLQLYVDGKLVGSAACDGRRSSERLVIGGDLTGRPGGDATKAEKKVSHMVDELSLDAGFRGTLVRLSVFGCALSAEEVNRMYARAESLPFWE